MELFQLNRVGFSYDAREIIRDASWVVRPGEKWGFVGPNGSGKTTVFKLIAGDEEPRDGMVTRRRGLRLAWFRQQVPGSVSGDVRTHLRAAFSSLLEVEERLRVLMEKIAAGGAPEDLEEYGRLEERFEHEGGYVYEAKMRMVLAGLGFGENDLDRPLSDFSGGERSRLLLARVLLEEPELMLLDEPTNHLDIEATEWLEEFLRGYEGAAVVISHDRYFLDRVARNICEMEDHALVCSSGNYTEHQRLMAERRERLQREYEREQEEVARIEDFIQRNIAGQKTRQAQSRRKMLARREPLRRPPGSQNRSLKMDLKKSRRESRLLASLENVTFAYPGAAPVLRGVRLGLERGDRVGLIGSNGSGKSTILKLLAGSLSPMEGAVVWGGGAEPVFYDQELADLRLEDDLIGQVHSVAPNMTMEEARGHLGRFGFSGEVVFQRVAELSGGEQSRLALAKLVLKRANFLVLDEPTNHLDIPGREVIEEALREYAGSFLLVSHDRYFLDKVVEKIYHLEEGKLSEYLGNYSYYLEKKAQEREALESPPEEPRPRARETADRGRSGGKPRGPRRRSPKKLEEEIAALEEQVSVLDEDLRSPELAADWEKLAELSKEKQGLTHRIEELVREWEQAHEAGG